MNNMVLPHEHPFGVKEYEYFHQFSDQEIQDIIKYFHKNFYDCGIIDYHRPGYQTPGSHNFFSIQKQEFQKLKNTFLESIRQYINQQTLIDRIGLNQYNVHTWCYMNWESSGRNNTDDELKHIHNATNPNAISGIFYLKLPRKQEGETEFHLGGNKFKLPSKELSWFIFPSNYLHTPGKLSSNGKRYVISADIWFN
ncbi:MAG: hypothetical protein ACO3CD_04685 [Candidatus Nanopelagicaceae bacterium]